MSDHERWMRRALELAARAAGETSPNPMVGCVVVKAGRVVGEGLHRRAGGPHAEPLALRSAGPRARGATLYVNLEPCSHQGRTPPCAPRLVEAGIARVVAAMRDPDPRVRGRGFACLERAGIEVRAGVLEAEATLLNERFVVAARRRRPFVLLKAALSLDGRIATAGGDSRWITGGAQRRQARRLRRLHDALAVGIGTVLADDPLLLPRPPLRRLFHRVVFDSRLRLPPDSRLVRSARMSPVWALCVEDAPRRRRRLEALGVRVLRGAGNGGRVSAAWALRALWREGVTSLMVEGGSELLGSFLDARLLDQLALFRGPMLLGGRDSLAAFGGKGRQRVAESLRLWRSSPLLPRGTPPLASPLARAMAPDAEIWYPRRLA